MAPSAFAPAIAATATAPPVVFSFLWASMSNTVALFGLLVYAGYDLRCSFQHSSGESGIKLSDRQHIACDALHWSRMALLR